MQVSKPLIIKDAQQDQQDIDEEKSSVTNKTPTLPDELPKTNNFVTEEQQNLSEEMGISSK